MDHAYKNSVFRSYLSLFLLIVWYDLPGRLCRVQHPVPFPLHRLLKLCICPMQSVEKANNTKVLVELQMVVVMSLRRPEDW